MKRLLKKLGRWLLRMLLWFLGITFCWVLLGRWVNPSLTYLMVERYFECEEDCSINKQWKNYEYISENMALAVIAAEDQNFFEHQGFDMESIERAIKDKRKGKRLRGASTISQQVAKNVFLWHGRSWLRKGLEVYFTFMVETLWSKKRIIEVYLNVAELGDGIYGAEAAAQAFFKKPAMKLTSREAALIATVLPNPRKMKISSPSGYMYKRQGWILEQMNNLGGTTFLHPDEEK